MPIYNDTKDGNSLENEVINWLPDEINGQNPSQICAGSEPFTSLSPWHQYTTTELLNALVNPTSFSQIKVKKF